METITELPTRCTHPLESIELLCTLAKSEGGIECIHKAAVRCMKCGSEFILPSIYMTPWSLCDFSEVPIMKREVI